MKTNKLILFAFSIVFVAIGCNNSNTENMDGFSKRYSLHGEIYDKDIIMRPIGPMGIFAIDSMLFIVSSGISDGFVQILNLNNDLEELGKFGSIGQGPGEFIAPDPTFAGDSYFLIQNINANEIAKLGISKTGNQIQAHEISRFRIEPYSIQAAGGTMLGGASRSINPLGDEYFVGVISDPNNGYFTFYDKNMDFITSFGKPPVFESRIPAFSYLRRLSGDLAANSNSFVFSATNIPYIAYYSLEKGDTIPTLKWEDTYGKISYTTENGNFNFTDNAIGMNRGVQNKDKYIYVLNIELPLNEISFSSTEKSIAKAIFVFNHKGERVARLDLDYGLRLFHVSKDEKTIYGITLNPEFMVVKYDIPEL